MPQRETVYDRAVVISLVIILVGQMVMATPVEIYRSEEDSEDSNYSSSHSVGRSSSDGSSQIEDKWLKRAQHSLNKRSFYDINCKGIYDKSLFARVDQICEDCYNLFREPKLHTLCRQNCFTSEYFKGCVDVLLLTDEIDKLQEWITKLNGLGV